MHKDGFLHGLVRLVMWVDLTIRPHKVAQSKQSVFTEQNRFYLPNELTNNKEKKKI